MFCFLFKEQASDITSHWVYDRLLFVNWNDSLLISVAPQDRELIQRKEMPSIAVFFFCSLLHLPWCCQPWSICGFCQQYLPSARLKCWRWHVAWAVQLLPNPVLVSDLRFDYMYTSYYSNCSLIQLRTLFLKLDFRFILYTYLKNVQFWDFKDEQLVETIYVLQLTTTRSLLTYSKQKHFRWGG